MLLYLTQSARICLFSLNRRTICTLTFNNAYRSMLQNIENYKRLKCINTSMFTLILNMTAVGYYSKIKLLWAMFESKITWVTLNLSFSSLQYHVLPNTTDYMKCCPDVVHWIMNS
jgi:hypothetical protein